MIDPFVNRFSPTGRQNRPLTVPDNSLSAGQETWGVPDNLEIMTFGPPLSDGHQLLITISDNSFNTRPEHSVYRVGSDLGAGRLKGWLLAISYLA